jgi:hypothetical protein
VTNSISNRMSELSKKLIEAVAEQLIAQAVKEEMAKI